MPCPHNASKIVILNTKIKALKRDINDLNTNIKEYKKARTDLNTLNCKLICVNNNIIEGDNHVSSNSLYDNGALDKMLTDVKNSVEELSNNIIKCQDEIVSINAEITAKEAEIASLQGDCSSCAAAKAAEELSSSTSFTSLI